MTNRSAIAPVLAFLLCLSIPLCPWAEELSAAARAGELGGGPQAYTAGLSVDAAEAYANGETPLLPAAVPETAPGKPAFRNLWDRIRSGFYLREMGGPLVHRHESWYVQRPDYVQRMVERSRRYLYFVVEELEKRHMPMEIALLPMIESSYNPDALSTMRAAGIWQFIPSTGRKYGLQQNFWYDGRRDVLAATRAALDYLQFLYVTFGDWELALAAYNWGEGAVQRAISRNQARRQPTDYESLRMPLETRNYLPKLQAVKNLIAEPDAAGITLDPIPNEPYFAVVDAPRQIDLKKAAQLAGVPVAEFRSLNPGHNRPVITASGPASLVVPADKAAAFAANLQRNAEPLVTWQAYELRKGERLETIARRFGISNWQLKEANGLKARSRLRPGQMLLVPGQGEEEEALPGQGLINAGFTLAQEESASATSHRHTPTAKASPNHRKGQARVVAKATQRRVTAKATQRHAAHPAHQVSGPGHHPGGRHRAPQHRRHLVASR